MNIKTLNKIVYKIIQEPKKIMKVFKILFKEGPMGIKKRFSFLRMSQVQEKDINQQYRKWLKKNYPSNKELSYQKKESELFKKRPKISIITPTFNTTEKFLRECIESVINQTYNNWELCIADDASEDVKVREIIEEYANKDKRIKYIYRKKNGHICRTSNDALKLATGDFVGLLDHDDFLWPNALYEVAKVLNENKKAEFIYCDEDKLEEDAITHSDPFFKPDWCPYLLRSFNYITHFAVLNKKLVNKLGGFRIGMEGAQDWDLYLRASQKSKNIVHIPKILYSWRKSSQSTSSRQNISSVKKYAFANQKKVLQQDLERRGYMGEVRRTEYLGLWQVKYKIEHNPLVSIIIPTKDKFEYIYNCIESILNKTIYKNYEINIIDTGSTDQKVINYFNKLLETNSNIHLYKWDKEFNFSSVCNYGASLSKGEYLLFLNNDTKVISNDWIEEMLMYAQMPDVGAVGCKLLYPNEKIQHAGIILGISGGAIERGVAGHAFINEENIVTSYRPSLFLFSVREYAAVTAACLMINRKKFRLVNGFDASFRIAFNDVDLNLKLLKKGFKNIFTPHAIVNHHESISVGKPGQNHRDVMTFHNEIKMMLKRYNNLLYNDPYYNPNYNLFLANFHIKIRQ